MSEKIRSGDFIKLEFTGRVKSSDAVFDSTSEADAKKGGIFNERARYQPALVVVGKGQLLKGIDEALPGMEVGQSRSIELEPPAAFGEHNPGLVRVMPVSEFRKRDIEPYPGMVLNLDEDQTALVRSVTSGRVTIDMNHSLAGQTVTYDLKVIAKLDSLHEKLAALAEHYGLKPTALTARGEEVEVHIGPQDIKDAQYLVNKQAFVDAVMRWFDEFTSVKVVESFKKEKKEEKKS